MPVMLAQESTERLDVGILCQEPGLPLNKILVSTQCHDGAMD